jgi:hypothetical protein
MDVDSIATRMKSNKRRRSKTNEQTRKKSRKTRAQNLDILSSAESACQLHLHPEGSKFTLGVGLGEENFTFVHACIYILYE